MRAFVLLLVLSTLLYLTWTFMPRPGKKHVSRAVVRHGPALAFVVAVLVAALVAMYHLNAISIL